MADFPYTPHPASVKRFLTHAQSAGVPEKVTQNYLEKVGFKSKNDRYIISVLKFIGFLDITGSPTKLWQDYRNKSTARATMANAIRRAYDDLFRTFPDAHRKDAEALRNYFSAHTKVADSTLGLIVSTFKAVAELADFDADAPVADASVDGHAPQHEAKSQVARSAVVASDSGLPAVNINIQLQLPATSDGDIYEKLFSALKKHLFS